LTVFDANTALLNYWAEQDTTCNGNAVPSPAWVSSLYVRRGERWVNALYQQTPTPKQNGSGGSNPPEAQPADVASIEGIIKSAFKIMSGTAGESRDWTRFRSLFKPSAQFIIAPKGPDGSINFTVRSIDEFISSSSEWLSKNSLYEAEVYRVTEQYGHLAHAFSTYESREKPGASQPSARGISSFQLVHDGKRWWIVNWFWLGERPNMHIHPNYLPRN
jgi:hypothetical protein